jgi:hypothetical protein
MTCWPSVNLLDPERAVLVEHRDAVLRENVARARPVDGGAHEVENRLLRRPVRGVVRLVGTEGGVVSGVINLESSGVEALDWRPRHHEDYHEA